jgi:hypothetical protein
VRGRIYAFEVSPMALLALSWVDRLIKCPAPRLDNLQPSDGALISYVVRENLVSAVLRLPHRPCWGPPNRLP